MNKKVFRNLSYGVYVVSTLDGTRPTGCTANSVMQITSEPASIAISINHDNYTNGCIARTGTFAVSILSEDSDPGLIGTFGFQSGKEGKGGKTSGFSSLPGVPRGRSHPPRPSAGAFNAQYFSSSSKSSSNSASRSSSPNMSSRSSPSRNSSSSSRSS